MIDFDLITSASMANKNFRVPRLEGTMDGWEARGVGGLGQLRGEVQKLGL